MASERKCTCTRRVCTDSQRVLIGICGRRPLWQTTAILHQNSLLFLLYFSYDSVKIWTKSVLQFKRIRKKTKFFITVKEKYGINGRYYTLSFLGTAFSTFSLISQKLLKISIPNFNIILRDIFGLHLFTGSGNRRVYTDSQRVLIGICGRRPLWQTTTIWQQNTLMAKCIIALLLFCQNL